MMRTICRKPATASRRGRRPSPHTRTGQKPCAACAQRAVHGLSGGPPRLHPRPAGQDAPGEPGEARRPDPQGEARTPRIHPSRGRPAPRLGVRSDPAELGGRPDDAHRPGPAALPLLRRLMKRSCDNHRITVRPAPRGSGGEPSSQSSRGGRPQDAWRWCGAVAVLGASGLIGARRADQNGRSSERRSRRSDLETQFARVLVRR